jgi:hypothetical protein
VNRHVAQWGPLLAVTTLMSGLVAVATATTLAVTAAPAAADTSGGISLFYAAPSTDGTSITVAGLLHAAPNTAYDDTTNADIEIDSDVACGGELVSQVGRVSATTDGNGDAYFSATFPAGAGFVRAILQIPGPPLVSSCYPVGPDNTAWENALNIPLVGGAGSAAGTIGLPGESRWYKFQVAPDSKVTVTLSGLANDDAIAVYKDISQANADVSAGTTSLNKLSAEFAADTFSPSAFIPSAFIPSAFIPSAFIPSAFIPSAFIPSAFIPSAFIPSAFIPSAFIPSAYSPSAFIPSAFIPSAFIPSAFIPSAFIPSAFIPSAFIPSAFIPSAFIPSTYSSAVNRSLITFNDEGGSSNKTLTVNTWQSTGSFYVRVAGRDGTFDPTNQFQVSVNSGSAACPASVVPIGSAPGPVASSGRKTVILTDSARLPGSAAEKSDVLTQLQTLAARPEVSGAVVDLSADSRVKALNAQADANTNCPFAKNLVANAVRDIVSSYRTNNPLAYVVVAGGDSTVPFFRHPDQTLMGNETGYTPPVADTSASQASLRLGYTLSDNDYGARSTISLKSDTFPVPDLAVGRLVESAPEISGQIQAYLGTTGGVLPTPTSSLVTGYDFLTLPANAVKDELAAGTGLTPDTLIAPRQLAPSDPASWTGTDLRNKVLNSGRHDVVFLAGHFSANDALAADYTTDMLTTDMEQSGVDLTNSLVFSAGCHSGFNIVDSDAVPNVTLTLDWPEEFARKRAILIGGTGYQYGDTDFIAYSEQIYVNFSHQLRLGTGAVPIGQALLKAKQDYLTNTPQLDEINQKALLEATLYGLPMASINMPAGRIPVPPDSSIVSSTTALGTNPGSTLGLRSSDVTVTPQLASNSVAMNDISQSNAPVTATYLSGSNGISTHPYQPVLPLETRNVSVPGQTLRGALFLGGTYTDTPGVTPLTGAPATEIRGVHTGFDSDVFFPEKPWSVNYFDALDGHGTGATRLLLTPAQHRSDAGGATTDTRRQFDSMNFRLFYSANTTTYGTGNSQATPALASAPDIVQVQAFEGFHDPGQPVPVDLCITVGGNPSAGIQDTEVTWSDASKTSGSWQSTPLTNGGCNPQQPWSVAPTDSTSWGGTVDLGTTALADFRFMVQAVNGVGLVSLDDNFGAYYSVGAPTIDQSEATIVTDVQVAPSSAPYGSTVTVSGSLHHLIPTDGFTPPQITTPIAGQPVTFSVGTQTATGVTDGNGQAQAALVLNVPPGQYTASASFYQPNFGASAANASQPLTVTGQATLLSLAPTPGPLATGATSVTATLCATSASTCGTTDPPVSSRSVVFVLAGPVNSTTAALTNGAGQARFDAFGLPVGQYTLQAYFDGPIPGVGTLTDAFYLPSSASATVTSTTADTTAPTLTVPASVSVQATGTGGAIVSYVASATDNIDPRPRVACSPGSVTLFPTGTTTVSCTATDTAGNSVTKTFPVTVQPQSPKPTPLSTGATTCNGTYSGVGTDVVVPAGGVCRLVAGTVVSHNITVNGGGALNTQGVTVGNDVILTGPLPSAVCGTTIAHDLSVANAPTAAAATALGDPTNGCAANRIGHDLVVRSNASSVTVGGNQVGHDLSATSNSGKVTIGANRIGHDLVVQGNKPGGAAIVGNIVGNNATCSGNSPQTGSGNTAGGTRSCPA